MKQLTGAGGTEGGTGRFFIGLVMLLVGGYLFLNNIHVGHNIRFGFGYNLFHVGGFGIISGYVLIPFIFGIGFIFYNYKNIIGWILTIGSLLMLGFGVITNIHFSFRPMSAFELIMILILLVGGIGLFLSSLRSFNNSEKSQ